ncbi:MAG TPA: adenylate/guanylate cyclase domain-containing protein [Casimicrobiaceae bacterium]|nr:adenylate/guanylate cyclase domain-containing protein [Casimicrobiaceae bacterium]
MHTSAGIVTFLFTDVEGSSRLWEEQPERMEGAMASHDAILRAAVESNRGTVVKMAGDGLHAAFEDPLDAMKATLAIQLALSDSDATNGIALQARCGLHVGAVERRDNDFFGRAVNRAARIMSAAHGGQALVSQAIYELVRDRLPADISLLDLGSVRLRDMINSEQVYQLVHPRLRVEFPPPRSLESANNNLPQLPTSFIGRETELRQVKELLAQNRLVSLVGSAGIGKTRLALQAAADVAARFADGAWLIDLAPLSAPELVAETVASTFRAAAGEMRSATDAVATCLREKRLLLILDNCEHLLTGVARLVATVLQHCPGVTILVTSRELLSVRGEYAFRMPPLTFPEQPSLVTASEAMRYGAVCLFVGRADAALGGFTLTDTMAPVVAEICKRLDGIALAIEFAAPRLKILKPRELLSRLNERFRILTGGDRTALPRQQTLEAAIDWSYRLLNEKEQTLLRRLAIFTDTFTIEGACGVAADPPIEAAETFDLVAALVDKSLIVPLLTSRGASRYKLLESTRQFGVARLRETGDVSRQRRLAQYLIELYEEAEHAWDDTPDDEWYGTYEGDLENVRSCLAWSFGRDGDPALGVALVARTVQLVRWWRRAERQRWFETAGKHLDEATPMPIVARVKLGLASSAGTHFGQRRGLDQALDAAEIFRRLGDHKNCAWALMTAAESLVGRDTWGEAESFYHEAEALLRPLGATKYLAGVLAGLAAARCIVASDTATTRALLEESLSLARPLGYARLIENATILLAEIEAADGQLDEAIATAREAEAALRQSGNVRLLYITLSNLAGYLLAAGEIETGEAAGVEGLRLAQAHGDDFVVHVLVEHLALAAAHSSEPVRAARLAGYGSTVYRSDRAREHIESRNWASLTVHLDAALTPDEKTALMQEGAAWTEDQAAKAAVAGALTRQHRAANI